jgi:hypothetical protein
MGGGSRSDGDCRARTTAGGHAAAPAVRAGMTAAVSGGVTSAAAIAHAPRQASQQLAASVEQWWVECEPWCDGIVAPHRCGDASPACDRSIAGRAVTSASATVVTKRQRRSRRTD